jgi:hypothetical protein
MADEEKHRFGDTMRLVESAREDIYFAERDRHLFAVLREKMKKVERTGNDLRCPKCLAILDTYTLYGFVLDRCASCGGIWIDQGELEGVFRQITRGIGNLSQS